MYYDPTPHQVEDSDRILEFADALLWADAGTGKTVTAMEAIRKGGYEKVIVVCPKLAVTMWKEELEKHLGPNFYAVTQTSTRFKKGRSIFAADALITTFGIARNLIRSNDRGPRGFAAELFIAFQKGGFNKNEKGWRGFDDRYKTVVIIDEAHNLKSKDAQQTQAAFGPRITRTPGCVTYGAASMWQLTGTPVMRYFDDLWTQLRAARPELLKYYKCYEYEQFVNMFCRTKMTRDHRGVMRRVVCGNTNHKLLEKLLADCYVIRRKLADVVADMPPITHRIVSVGYSGVAKGKVMEEAALLKELNDPDSETAAIRRKLGIAKAKEIAEYVNEYGKKPVLIGFWHREVCDALMEHLEFEPAIVDGSTSTKARDLIREQFNSGEIPGILGQMQAMNSSWNIQEASSHVIVAEELPSPGLLHQFYSRVYRRGQQRHVHVDHMLSEHSLDVALRNIRLRKQADNERINL